MIDKSSSRKMSLMEEENVELELTEDENWEDTADADLNEDSEEGELVDLPSDLKSLNNQTFKFQEELEAEVR